MIGSLKHRLHYCTCWQFLPHEQHTAAAVVVANAGAAVVVAAAVATIAVDDTFVSAACLSYCTPALRDNVVVVQCSVVRVVANAVVNVVANCTVCCRMSVWKKDLSKECVVVCCCCCMCHMDIVCLIGKD